MSDRRRAARASSHPVTTAALAACCRRLAGRPFGHASSDSVGKDAASTYELKRGTPLDSNPSASGIGRQVLRTVACVGSLLRKRHFVFRSADAYFRELSEKPQSRSGGCGHPRSYATSAI